MKCRVYFLILVLVPLAAVLHAQTQAGIDPAAQSEIVVDGKIESLDTPSFSCVPFSTFKDGDKVPASTETDRAWSNSTKQLKIGPNTLAYPVIATITDSAGLPQVLILATLKLKADLNPAASLHKNGFIFTATRAFKSTEAIPVLLIGGTIVSLEVMANQQDPNDFKPSLTLYADDSSASDRTSAMSVWLIEMKHIRK